MGVWHHIMLLMGYFCKQHTVTKNTCKHITCPSVSLKLFPLKIWHQSFIMSPHLSLSLWAVSRHLVNQISCKMDASTAITTVYFGISQTPAIIVSLLSLILNAELICWQTQAEIKEELQPVRQAFSWWPHLLVSAGCFCLWLCGMSSVVDTTL